MNYNVKKLVFNSLSKNQKTELCNYLKKFVEKNNEYSVEDIIDAFVEEEQYYLDMKTSRHAWLEDFLCEEEFLADVKKYIKDCKFALEIKLKQKPFLDEQKQQQKEFNRQQKKALQDKKMSLEKPTSKQKTYYKVLCKKYGMEPVLSQQEEATRLDYKNAIEKILEETFKK